MKTQFPLPGNISNSRYVGSGRRYRTRGAIGLGISVVLLATGAAVVPSPVLAVPAQGSTASRSAASVDSADLTMKDGVVLRASVATPEPGTQGADARGRYPAIVLPASWGSNDKLHTLQARDLASHGYVVVSYTPRGFWSSGGKIDVAGPRDRSDISSVIDWTLANTPADEDRVGMVGVSLGAGLSLMGAAFDERVKVVAAMSGWGDLGRSLFHGETRHLQSAAALYAVKSLTGTGGAELEETMRNHFTGRHIDKGLKWAAERSPVTFVEKINDKGTPIFLANAWGDSVFNPNQIVDFHKKLTVPKRLEMRPGEHATAELTSFLGLPNDTWASARNWLDQHLKSKDADSKDPVNLEVRLNGKHETYPDWRAISNRTERLGLGKPNWFGTGELSDKQATGWRRSVVGGMDSGADGGITLVSGFLDQVAKLPPMVSVPLLPRPLGAVWQTDRSEEKQRIRGTVKLHTTVTSSSSKGTAIAYLYDVDSLGFGKLISHGPQSWRGKPPKKPFSLDISLFTTAYDVPQGHRLALVIDTADPLYAGTSPLLSKVTFSSSKDDPAHLEVPLR